MHPALYKESYTLEEYHWWFQGRRKIIFDIINCNIPVPIGALLDIGCGAGLNMLLLQQKAKRVVGMEMSEEAFGFAKERNPDIKVIKGRWPDVELKESFDVVTLFDVLEHIKEDGRALQKLESSLTHGGFAVITVPAFECLWSEHDELAHHYRRYRKHGLAELIEKNTHLKIYKISYFNMSFFFPMLIFRFLKNVLGIRSGSSDLTVWQPLNSLCAYLFSCERWLLRFFNLPFGASILCVVKRD